MSDRTPLALLSLIGQRNRDDPRHNGVRVVQAPKIVAKVQDPTKDFNP